MTFALIVAHAHVGARVTVIYVEWIFQNTHCCAWEVLVDGEAWDVHQS